jgi:hypothetical protein
VGYLVATTGRLLLPAHLERQALTVAEHRMAARQGFFDPDRAHEVDTLSELATYAGVTLTREGEWLAVATDHDGDPKWSEQAEEFYRAIAGFVQQGEVHLRGEDGSTWSYAYSPAGLQETGAIGGDGAPPVAGSTVASPSSPAPAPEPPATPQAPPPATQDPADEGRPPEAPQQPETGFIDYPGRQERPPGPPKDRPAAPPGMQDAGWAGVDDDPPPAPPGRVVLMTVVLVVGVLLIIGLALLASGF